MFDDRGLEILDHWLSGSGEPIITNGGVWGKYMMANDLLKKQLRERILADAKTRTASGNIDLTFSAVIENGYFTGYEMLHGTNADVGGFHIRGRASVTNQSGGETKIDYALTYTWNDIIDPKPQYDMDTLSSRVLKWFYYPKDYEIHITWEANACVSKTGEEINGMAGYPLIGK
jgi:hypothetical protein